MRAFPSLIAGFILLAATGAHAQGRALDGGAPWQAQLFTPHDYSVKEAQGKTQAEAAHKCGGALIAEGWVLTAAHCMTPADMAKGWRIRLGSLDLEFDDGVSFRIDRVIPHPDYNKKLKRNDVELVHFVADDDTDYDGAGRIAAIRRFGTNDADDVALAPGTPVTAMGFGRTVDDKTRAISTELLQVDLNVTGCEDAPAEISSKTADSNICAYAPGKDTCQGDSGGPLVLTNGPPVLVGIVSWGVSCGKPGYPGVYARVSDYSDWIDRTMAADPVS